MTTLERRQAKRIEKLYAALMALAKWDSFNVNLRRSNDKIWALREASKRGGFTPHAKSPVELLRRLEREGLIRQSDLAPVWFITDAGKIELRKLEQ